jgi:hypothetical protein
MAKSEAPFLKDRSEAFSYAEVTAIRDVQDLTVGGNIFLMSENLETCLNSFSRKSVH